MVLPKKIRIGPFIFQIIPVQGLHSDGKGLWGEVRHTRSEIAIESDLADQEQYETLLHEVFHVILTQAGRDKETDDESLMDVLANGLMGVLRDNPGLQDWYDWKADNEPRASL